MNALGIHLTRRGARAVIVSEDGTVQSAAAVDVPDASAAVQEAVRQAASDQSFGVTAVAANTDEGLDLNAVVASLRDESGFEQIRIVSAGAAAVMAEEWVGAAKGARHAICLWIGEDVLAGILLDGQPWAGAHGLAGSAAWLALNPVEIGRAHV